MYLVFEHKIESHFMSPGLFQFHFNLSTMVEYWIVNGLLNNCKKRKIFRGKYAIYNWKFQISSFGLTRFAKPRLASIYLCSFCSQVSEGEKK